MHQPGLFERQFPLGLSSPYLPPAMQDALKAEGPIPGADPEATETSFADLFKKVGGSVCQQASKLRYTAMTCSSAFYNVYFVCRFAARTSRPTLPSSPHRESCSL